MRYQLVSRPCVSWRSQHANSTVILTRHMVWCSYCKVLRCCSLPALALLASAAVVLTHLSLSKVLLVLPFFRTTSASSASMLAVEPCAELGLSWQHLRGPALSWQFAFAHVFRAELMVTCCQLVPSWPDTTNGETRVLPQKPWCYLLAQNTPSC